MTHSSYLFYVFIHLVAPLTLYMHSFLISTHTPNCQDMKSKTFKNTHSQQQSLGKLYFRRSSISVSYFQTVVCQVIPQAFHVMLKTLVCHTCIECWPMANSGHQSLQTKYMAWPPVLVFATPPFLQAQRK